MKIVKQQFRNKLCEKKLTKTNAENDSNGIPKTNEQQKSTQL